MQTEFDSAFLHTKLLTEESLELVSNSQAELDAVMVALMRYKRPDVDSIDKIMAWLHRATELMAKLRRKTTQ